MKKRKKVDLFKILKKHVYNESFWKVRDISTRGIMVVEVQIPIATRIHMSLDVKDEASIKPIANFMKRQAITSLIEKLKETLEKIPVDHNCDGKYETPC